MKKQTKSKKHLPAGLPEFLAVLGIVLLIVLAILLIRSCTPSGTSFTPETTPAETEEKTIPTTTELLPLPIADIGLPLNITQSITVDNLFTATGYYPEDGTDEEVENILAAKFTNTNDKTLEYLTASLTVNGEVYNFAITTVPAHASVYVFNAERKTAPETVSSLNGAVEYEIFFREEPTKMEDIISLKVENGMIVVENISSEDITSDIVVYYKSAVENGYLGGITYRLRAAGGLKAGESYNGYAPHSYAHMTEVMFVELEGEK